VEAAPQAPPEERFRSWIADYGAIFLFQHVEQIYIYRRLSRREYRAIIHIEDELERAEEVCETTLLWPEGWKADAPAVQDGPAGVPDAICAQVLNSSGIIDMEGRLGFYQGRIVEDFEAQMETMIDYAFDGGGLFARYSDWSHDQLFDAYARACWILEATTPGLKIQQSKKEEEKPIKPPRGLNNKERMAELQERLNKNQQVADESGSTLGVIDGADRAALKPLSEVLPKFEKAQRRQQLMASLKQNRS
jgi:hypothetical protein